MDRAATADVVVALEAVRFPLDLIVGDVSAAFVILVTRGRRRAGAGNLDGEDGNTPGRDMAVTVAGEAKPARASNADRPVVISDSGSGLIGVRGSRSDN